MALAVGAFPDWYLRSRLVVDQTAGITAASGHPSEQFSFSEAFRKRGGCAGLAVKTSGRPDTGVRALLLCREISKAPSSS